MLAAQPSTLHACIPPVSVTSLQSVCRPGFRVAPDSGGGAGSRSPGRKARRTPAKVRLPGSLSAMARSRLVAGQIGSAGEGRRVSGPPLLVYAALFEVNKASAFSAVFAATRRAIRTLV